LNLDVFVDLSKIIGKNTKGVSNLEPDSKKE